MLIELMLDEGFEIGWNYFSEEPFEDEDIRHHEKVKSNTYYHKGVLVSKKPGLDKRGRLLARR